MIERTFSSRCQTNTPRQGPFRNPRRGETFFNGQAGITTGTNTSEKWWSQTGSNRRPHACKARALPTELWPLSQAGDARMVGPERFELSTSRLSSARSNQLSYGPRLSSTSKSTRTDLAICRAGNSSEKKEKRRRRIPRCVDSLDRLRETTIDGRCPKKFRTTVGMDRSCDRRTPGS